MRERRRIKPEQSEIPISSMIDVVFLLLIYFLVVQKPIIENTFLQADLPDPSRSHNTVKNPDFLRIDVVKQPMHDGHDYYRMNDRWWRDGILFAHLEKTARDNPEKTIIINCGPNARHQKLVTLLDACAKARLTNLNIVNDATIEFKKVGN